MRKVAVGVAAACCALALHANPYYDPSKPHHTPQGFRNVTGAQVSKPFSWLVRWRF